MGRLLRCRCGSNVGQSCEAQSPPLWCHSNDGGNGRLVRALLYCTLRGDHCCQLCASGARTVRLPRVHISSKERRRPRLETAHVRTARDDADARRERHLGSKSEAGSRGRGARQELFADARCGVVSSATPSTRRYITTQVAGRTNRDLRSAGQGLRATQGRRPRRVALRAGAGPERLNEGQGRQKNRERRAAREESLQADRDAGGVAVWKSMTPH